MNASTRHPKPLAVAGTSRMCRGRDWGGLCVGEKRPRPTTSRGRDVVSSDANVAPRTPQPRLHLVGAQKERSCRNSARPRENSVSGDMFQNEMTPTHNSHTRTLTSMATHRHPHTNLPTLHISLLVERTVHTPPVAPTVHASKGHHLLGCPCRLRGSRGLHNLSCFAFVNNHCQEPTPPLLRGMTCVARFFFGALDGMPNCTHAHDVRTILPRDGGRPGWAGHAPQHCPLSVWRQHTCQHTRFVAILQFLKHACAGRQAGGRPRIHFMFAAGVVEPVLAQSARAACMV